MTDVSFAIGTVRVPRLLYGTAWKEDETQRLTQLALQQGFRGIDTANQRKHYHEAAVGQALAAASAAGVVRRDELFLQTKFTFRRGQDQRLPYDPNASIGTQVVQSFSSSCAHLGTQVIDSFLLHGPTLREGLVEADWAAWRAIETLHEQGQARLIGVSNFSLSQLEALWRHARVRPHFVQNRCYAVRGWDRAIRQWCNADGVVYQGFSLLTANREVLASALPARIARRHGCSVSQIIFRFALQLGMVALTGTTDVHHMHADLDIMRFALDDDEVARIESCAET
jgi:diketogulonate reductase-like aldo/keto reductase